MASFINMNFIVYKDRGQYCPFIFPSDVAHSQVAIEDLQADVEIVSAGIFYIISNQIVVSLEKPATSLNNLKPRPEDQALIEALFIESGLYEYYDN